MANQFDPTTVNGLVEYDATQRLKLEGYNELPASRHRSIWAIAWEIIQDPIFLLLVACGGIYQVRALTFTTLILANLGLILSDRSWSGTNLATLRSPNVALWWVVGGGLVFLGLVLYVPFLRHLFRFSFLHPIDLVICLAALVVCILWFEKLKILNRKR